MGNIVSKDTALRLQEAGWEKETEKVWCVFSKDGVWFLVDRDEALDSFSMIGWLPAPNVTELGERLSYRDFVLYYNAHGTVAFEDGFSHWLYSVMHDSDALAEVWLWVNAKKKGE